MKIDREVLGRVADDLKLTKPIRITLHRTLPERQPNCTTLAQYDALNTSEHHILLNTSLDLDDAVHGVLHELRHARQSEQCRREGLDQHKLYYWADKRWGYERNPFEIDAERYAYANALRFGGLVYR